MARLPRVEALETPHHVTQRGNARRQIFDSDADYQVYLAILGQHARLRGLHLIGYCLMPNHVHLIVVPRFPGAMASALRDAHGRYAAYLNARKASNGHLWQGRYYSCPMDSNHLWTALRYVELNPVRAGLVRRAEDHPWSSARAHLLGERGTVALLGEWSQRWSSSDWREFVEARDTEGSDRAVRLHTHTGRPLGTLDFVRHLEGKLRRPLAPAKVGRPRKKAVAEEAAMVGQPGD